MTSRWSYLSKLWNGFKQTARLPNAHNSGASLRGTDKDGNCYYESAAANGKRGRRWFVTKEGIDDAMDLWENNLPKIPLEWDAWLRGSRKDAPTAEEIARNLKVQNRTVFRAKKLEEQHRTEEISEQNGIMKSNDSSAKTPGVTGVNFPEYNDLEVNPGKKRKDS